VFCAALCGSAPRASALIWPSAVRALERELSADDVGVRRRAADRLSELPAQALARAALHALDDSDVEVRLLAARAARTAKLPGLGERLLAWLTESDARVRVASAEALLAAPTPRGVAPLIRALSDTDPAVRRVAAAALGASGSPDAVIGLLGRLDDSALEVRESVVEALAALADPRAVVPLVSKIEDSRPSVRRAVARALGALGDRRAQSALVLALRDADVDVRASALRALGALGDGAAVASIAALLTLESNASVRRAAIDSLSRIASAEAVVALVTALGALPEERDAFAAAFRRLQGAAVGPLIACLRAQGSPEKLAGCAAALSVTRAKEAGAEIRNALERGYIEPEAGLLALARAGDAETLAACLPYLGTSEPAVRRAALGAARALLDPRLGDGRAVEPLELAFARSRRQRSERLEVLRLLGRTGAPRAARLLVPLAEHADDLEFRVTALDALAELGPNVAPQTLLAGLGDPEAAVRLAAALAIRRARPPGLAEAIVDRLVRAAMQDRRALALALSGALSAGAPESAVQKVAQALAEARGADRDGLAEALGHVASPPAQRALRALSVSLDPADRAKAAEALGLGAGDTELLMVLARDAEGAVRANALWSIGALGKATALPRLNEAVHDTDPAVAANSVIALARVARRERVAVGTELCAFAAEPRAAVRASAFSGLHHVDARCGDGRERSALLRDASSRVRLAAALLLRDVHPDAADRRALERCAAEEPNGAVAAACSDSASQPAASEQEVLIFVVPPGEAEPTPRAPFALVRPDGLIRYGVADRRGALVEAHVPAGEVSLGVPAAFDE
jgi:HEAT repeat protein